MDLSSLLPLSYPNPLISPLSCLSSPLFVCFLSFLLHHYSPPICPTLHGTLDFFLDLTVIMSPVCLLFSFYFLFTFYLFIICYYTPLPFPFYFYFYFIFYLFLFIPPCPFCPLKSLCLPFICPLQNSHAPYITALAV